MNKRKRKFPEIKTKCTSKNIYNKVKTITKVQISALSFQDQRGKQFP